MVWELSVTPKISKMGFYLYKSTNIVTVDVLWGCYGMANVGLHLFSNIYLIKDQIKELTSFESLTTAINCSICGNVLLYFKQKCHSTLTQCLKELR